MGAVLVEDIVSAMADPLIACDGDERIHHLNPAAERLLGWTRDALVGRPFLVLLPQRLHTYGPHSLLRYLLERPQLVDGRPVRTSLLRRDHTELEVELTVGTSKGDTRECISVVLRRLHESPDYAEEPVEQLSPSSQPASTLSAGERAYQLVFENAPLGLFHFDGAGVLRTCNDYFARVLGASKRLLLGMNLLTLQDEALLGCVRDVLQGQHARYEGDYQAVTSGKRIPLRAHFAPLFNPQGQVEGGVCIVEDVTQQRSAEAERARLVSEAQVGIST